MPSASRNAFTVQMDYVEQLIDIHGRLQSGRGRRHKQEALHSAGVAMTVAAWQSYLEKLIFEAMDAIEADLNAAQAPRWPLHVFYLKRADIKTKIGSFMTPNADNSRRLLKECIDIDVWSAWEYRVGPRQWSAQETSNRTNAWLKIRHSFAHGSPLPDNIAWITGDNGEARLNLTLLKECKRHFTHLADKTDHEVGNVLRGRHGLTINW